MARDKKDVHMHASLCVLRRARGDGESGPAERIREGIRMDMDMDMRE